MTTTPPVRMHTADQHAAALYRAIHDDFLSLGGLSDIPACLECCALSGLLTGLVRMARELPTKAEYIEALVAEAAETLGLVEPEPAPCTAHGCTCHDCDEQATTHTRLSIFVGTNR